MKTFRMFTEDYVDSYALHRTTTGPGLDGYVPTANLNASKKNREEFIKLGKKEDYLIVGVRIKTDELFAKSLNP